MKFEIVLDGGKYTYHYDNGKQTALRYDEPWRDLCGDNLVFHLAAELHRYREACHGLDLPDDIPAGAVAALVAAARAIAQRWEDRSLPLGEDLSALAAALAPFTGDAAPPVSPDTDDRRPVWSFEVDGKHIRWCGTLDQWHKDRLAYVDKSEGIWEAHGPHMWRFIEPGVNGGKPVKTIFRAVKNK